MEDYKTVLVPFFLNFLNRQTMGGGHCVHVPTPELHLQYKHSEEERPTSTVSLAPCFLFSFFFFCGFAETEVTGLNLLGFCGALLRPEREGGRERKEDLITRQPATTKTNHLWIHCKH